MNGVEQYRQFATTAKHLHSLSVRYRLWASESAFPESRQRYTDSHDRLRSLSKDLIMRARWLKSGCLERGELA